MLNKQQRAALNIGDIVGVVHPGSWELMLEGVCRVTSKTKVAVTVERIESGYVRRFSIATGKELDKVYSKSFLISKEDNDRHTAARKHTHDVAHAWLSASSAVAHKDLARLEDAIANLKQLTGKA